jgi:S1-C subfamily serine protease
MAISLSDLSAQLATTVASLAPSVVRVKGRHHGVSTGVVFDDGLVVTTHHGLRRTRDIPVLLHGGQEAVATVIGRDPTTDLALLRVDGVKLQVPPWHDAEDLAVGHLVLALGRPGQGIRALWGIVGARGDAWETSLGGKIDRYIDVDATLRWGFSGGPLVDAEGWVIGINSAALTRGGTSIPTATVQRVVQRLLARGDSKGGFLGIGAHPVALPAEIAEEVGQEQAALVVAVEPDGPAEQAGLLLGDALISVDGKSTRTVAEVAAVLADCKAGQTVTLRVLRAGAVVEIEAKLGERA